MGWIFMQITDIIPPFVTFYQGIIQQVVTTKQSDWPIRHLEQMYIIFIPHNKYYYIITARPSAKTI